MKRISPQNIAILVITIALGYCVWKFSPVLLGRREPWDAKGGVYFIALFVLGIPFGLILRDMRVWLPALGLYIGQAIFIIISTPLKDVGFFFVIGDLVLAVCTLPVLTGTWLGSTIRKNISRIAHKL